MTSLDPSGKEIRHTHTHTHTTNTHTHTHAHTQRKHIHAAHMHVCTRLKGASVLSFSRDRTHRRYSTVLQITLIKDSEKGEAETERGRDGDIEQE